jgi:hypothetical protein
VLSEYLGVLSLGPETKQPSEEGDDLAGFSRYERAREQVIVRASLPGGGAAEARTFRLGDATSAYGELHHYRVVAGNGEMYLIPPDWSVGSSPPLVPADDGVLRLLAWPFPAATQPGPGFGRPVD